MFEHLGYIKEYYIGTKFMGSVEIKETDQKIGWENRRTEEITETITFKNGRKIKKGILATTIIYPLSGKHLENVHTKKA